MDHGPEFTSKVMSVWAPRCIGGVRLHLIDPGKPIQNAYIEIFNGKFTDECLNEHWFIDLSDARQIIRRRGSWQKVNRIGLQMAKPASTMLVDGAVGQVACI